MKAFPSPDLRCEAAISSANPCDPPEVFKEALNYSALPIKMAVFFPLDFPPLTEYNKRWLEKPNRF